MYCLPWSPSCIFCFSLLEYSTFSKLIFLFLFQLQSFVRSIWSLSISQHSIENVWNFYACVCARVCVCVCVCLMCKRFQHIRAHQRAYQHITSSCRNFEEIDFCRLIFSKVEIDCVILLAEHYCIYELIYVQREKEPRVKYARHAIQTRIQTKRKQNISLAHLTIFIQAMNARLYKQMNARFCSFLY